MTKSTSSAVSTSCRRCLRHGLVDRINLWVYPLLLGSGKKVFADGTVPRRPAPHRVGDVPERHAAPHL